MGGPGMSIGVDMADETDHLRSDVGVVTVENQAGEMGEVLIFKDTEAEKFAPSGGFFHGVGFPIRADAREDAELGALAVKMVGLGLETVEMIEGIDDGTASVVAGLGVEVFELRAGELAKVERGTLLTVIGGLLNHIIEFVGGQDGDELGFGRELLLGTGLEFGGAIEVCEHASNFLS